LFVRLDTYKEFTKNETKAVCFKFTQEISAAFLPHPRLIKE
jgi:hypothetical protein